MEIKPYQHVFTSEMEWIVFQEAVDKGGTGYLRVSNWKAFGSDQKLIIFSEQEFNDYVKCIEDRAFYYGSKEADNNSQGER